MQVLAYPATDLAFDRASVRENASGYFLTSGTIDWVRGFIGELDLDLKDPKLSPAYGKLQGSVPAMILTAGFDPIRDDGLNYAMLLRQAGVPVELLHYPGQVHGFLNFSAVFSGARDALDRIGASIARALSDDPPSERQPVKDCTLEIAAKSDRTSGLRGLADEAWMTTKLSIDWMFEHQRRAVVVASRASGMSALAPLAGRLQETAASLLMRSLGDRFDAIETRETYRAPSRRAPRTGRVKAELQK
jgi:acetyl esterase